MHPNRVLMLRDVTVRLMKRTSCGIARHPLAVTKLAVTTPAFAVTLPSKSAYLPSSFHSAAALPLSPAALPDKKTSRPCSHLAIVAPSTRNCCMGSRNEDDTDKQLLLSDDEENLEKKANLARLSSRNSAIRRLSGSRLRSSVLSKRLDTRDSDVAFSIVVKREPADGEAGADSRECEGTTVDIAHETVNEAVQDAVQDVRSQDKGHLFACGQAVQDAVQEAVQDAIQQALEDNVRFDVRANVFTLIAITGVILFWRGIWSLWDKIFGFSIWSELGSIAAGLGIMITFRLVGVPLLDGLPSG